MRLYGHVGRRKNEAEECRPKKVWLNAIRGDTRKCGMNEDIVVERMTWREKIRIFFSKD